MRTLLAALDNAEAPKLESGNGLVEHQFVDGSAEIERNILPRGQVWSVLRGEIVELESAAAEMVRLGKTQCANELRAQAKFIEFYVG